MINIKHLSKVYNNSFYALKEINLEINDGEFIGICGKSGCGKSTLLNLIGGLDTISCGSIIIDDTDISTLNDNSLSEYRNKNISYIFQAFYLEPNLNVVENVSLPLLIAGVDRKTREAKASKLLDSLSLKDKTKNKITQLSGGEMQRVAIARSIISNPKIILADEPTGNLDSQSGVNVINLLKQINSTGATVILVSHNMLDLSHCDRIITLSDGKIVEEHQCD